ncbi:hypothetical protein AB0D67_17160 [Streptosporangium sp. NPDC048047]|uniref:hypothetical protein n=1 Tax=Streptosporangium sp. NPDC048047 TaxID=3155748 RepID=UPI00343B9A32
MIHHAPRPSVWAGLYAVLRLLLSALDDLVAALAGARPLRRDAADFARLVGDAYRTGKNHVAEGDVLEADDVEEDGQ